MEEKEKVKGVKETVCEPIVRLGITLWDDGRIIIVENGQPVLNAKGITFSAEVGKSPEYSITKVFQPVREN